MFLVDKFPVLIITSPRCGSGAYGHQLAVLNPNIRFFNEPNYDKTKLDEFLEYSKDNNYILKILASSIKMFPEWYKKDIFKTDKIYTIKLQRNNIIDQIASHYVSEQRKKWHYIPKDNDDQTYYNSLEIDIKAIDYSIEQIKFHNYLVQNTWTDKTIIYEDFKDKLDPNLYVVKTLRPANYSDIVRIVRERYK